MKRHVVHFTMALWLLMGFTSCEKPLLSDELNVDPQEEKGLVHLTFQVSSFAQNPFSQGAIVSRATNVQDICSRISFALFQDGVKVKSINQDRSENNFGKIEVNVSLGSYQVVVIAHNGEASATITSPEEVTFAKNKLTDTFYYGKTLEVSANQSVELEMKRAVAMFRLIMNDAIPPDVTAIRLYYTGGSSTFNALTGFGCVNSRQTEDRVVLDAQRSGNAQFEVYTMPHSLTDVLKVTVSALNAAGEIVFERIFDQVPVKLNEITQYKGSFFQGIETSQSNTLTFWTTDQWTQVDYGF